MDRARAGAKGANSELLSSPSFPRQALRRSLIWTYSQLPSSSAPARDLIGELDRIVS
jgi:hypothetical protein